MMELTEALIAGAAQEVLGATMVQYQGQTIDLNPPWRRVTMNELVRDALPDSLDFEALDGSAEDLKRAQASASAAGVPKAEDTTSLGQLLALCFRCRSVRCIL
jgi:lysyl-tRNA synthetase class 2